MQPTTPIGVVPLYPTVAARPPCHCLLCPSLSPASPETSLSPLVTLGGFLKDLKIASCVLGKQAPSPHVPVVFDLHLPFSCSMTQRSSARGLIL